MLQAVQQRMPDDGPGGAGCALRLQCRLCQLAGWLVRPEEGLVLRSHWQGLPPCWWLRDDFGALRLQRWVRELDGGVVCGQEDLVLHSYGQGLPGCGGWLRLILMPTWGGRLSCAPAAGKHCPVHLLVH